MSDRPDAYISDISKSVILEVKAGELVVSDAYPTFYTLRFPRVVKVRYDKDWHEGMNQDQLNQLISNFNDVRRMNKFKHGLEVAGESSNQDNSDEDEESFQAFKGPRKKKKVATKNDGQLKRRDFVKDKKVVEFYRETDTTDVKKETSIFEGLEFYIVNTDDLKGASKPFLERLIVRHGGKKVQNLMPTTTHVIADRADFKVRSLVDRYDMNIVKDTWVTACTERGFLLELEPAYMIHSNQQLNNYFKNCLDPYNDHFTQAVDEKGLMDILNNISE